MSFTTPAYGEYGTNNVKARDHSMFMGKYKATIEWGGYGTVDNSPDVNLYLKRYHQNNARGLYIPEATYGGWVNNAICFDDTNAAGVHFFGTSADEFYRAAGGNVTLGVTALTLGTNLTCTPTANTTVQAVEMLVSDSDTEQAVYIFINQSLLWVNDTYKAAHGSQLFPAAATAALTTAE